MFVVQNNPPDDEAAVVVTSKDMRLHIGGLQYFLVPRMDTNLLRATLRGKPGLQDAGTVVSGRTFRLEIRYMKKSDGRVSRPWFVAIDEHGIRSAHRDGVSALIKWLEENAGTKKQMLAQISLTSQSIVTLEGIHCIPLPANTTPTYKHRICVWPGTQLYNSWVLLNA